MAVQSGGRGRILAALLTSAILPGLGACQTHGGPEVTGSLYPSDYRDRHPIVVADGPRVLDLFVESSGGLTPRSRQDLADYLTEYRRYGTSPLLVQAPSGGGANPNTGHALALIRQSTPGSTVQAYRPTDPSVASPIRLTFKRLEAKVGSQCGLWPDDLGVSDAASNWKNEQYWNFGCAHQANLASQVADPNDLVRARHETRPDTGRRMYNIQQLRLGIDPSTPWRDQQAAVASSVSQQ